MYLNQNLFIPLKAEFPNQYLAIKHCKMSVQGLKLWTQITKKAYMQTAHETQKGEYGHTMAWGAILTKYTGKPV